MITAIVQHVESVRKGVTLKVDIDDKLRPENIATWQDEDVVITNGKDIIHGNLRKIQALSDESTRLLVDIPRGDYPGNIFTWKHKKILIKKETDDGNSAETSSQKSSAQKGKRRKAN